MSVSSSTSRIVYAGNNSLVTAYAVPFYFEENAHLNAIAKTAAGVETVVTLTNHTGAGNENGGTVRTAVAVPTTSTLTIYREVPFTQNTSYEENDAFPAASHERALDKLTTITQQLERRITNCIRGTEATPLAPLPSPTGSEQFVLSTTVNQPPSWQPLPSLATGPVVATGSPQARFLSDRFADWLSVKDFGAMGNGVADDTTAIRAAVSAAETAFNARLVPGALTAKSKIFIFGTYRITGTITFNGSKVCFEGPGTFLVAAGTYTSNRVFVCNNNGGSVTNGAMSNISTDLFRNLNFTTAEASLIALYAQDTNGISINDASCLHSITNCRFWGFDKVFAHGRSGWGFSWEKCGFVACNYWLYLTNETNTYERHSASHCIFQNGGKLLYINNPNGKVYWHSGSIDYCTGIGDIVTGYAEINSHIEYTNRSVPVATITTGHLLISGGMLAIGLENGSTYNVIHQAADNQLSIKNLAIISDGSVTNATITNRPYCHSGIRIDGSAVGRLFFAPVYFDADMRSFDVALFGTGLTLVQDATKIEVTSSTGSGGSKGFEVFIPLNSEIAKNVGWTFTASNTAAGMVFVDKAFVSKNKAVATAFVIGDTFIAAGASNVTVDSDGGTVICAEHHGFLKLIFNCVNMGTSTVFTINALRPYVF